METSSLENNGIFSNREYYDAGSLATEIMEGQTGQVGTPRQSILERGRKTHCGRLAVMSRERKSGAVKSMFESPWQGNVCRDGGCWHIFLAHLAVSITHWRWKMR